MMRELSLFTGAGGGVLGTHHLLGWRSIGYVEWDKYCQQVIAARIRDGYLDDAPIYGDIRTFVSEGYAAAYTGMVDVITAGFPCQPFSTAGNQLGTDDERNMWPATIECARIVRPRFMFLENVPGLVVSGYFGTVLGDLAESGFDCRWRILSAAELGAPHKRDRLWIVAYRNGDKWGANGMEQNSWADRRHDAGGMGTGLPDTHSARRNAQDAVQSSHHQQQHTATPEQAGHAERGQLVSSGKYVADAARGVGDDIAIAESRQHQGHQQTGRCGSSSGIVSHSTGNGCRQVEQSVSRRTPSEGPEREAASRSGGWWATEPNVGRVVDGVAFRVDRIRALGNGQVSIVAATAWRLLTEDLHDQIS